MITKRGRRRRSGEEMARLGTEFRESGCSVGEFAQRHGVHWTTVRRWAERGRHPVPELVSVRLKPGGENAGETFEILSPGGWRVRVPLSAEASTLRRLVEGLGVC